MTDWQAMLKSERHEQLLKLCMQRGMVTVAQAAKIFGISEMTARRDFDELARDGGVSREHGQYPPIKRDPHRRRGSLL